MNEVELRNFTTWKESLSKIDLHSVCWNSFMEFHGAAFVYNELKLLNKTESDSVLLTEIAGLKKKLEEANEKLSRYDYAEKVTSQVKPKKKSFWERLFLLFP